MLRAADDREQPRLERALRLVERLVVVGRPGHALRARLTARVVARPDGALQMGSAQRLRHFHAGDRVQIDSLGVTLVVDEICAGVAIDDGPSAPS